MELGYGTEYEKFILRKIFQEICEKYKIESAFEYPKNDLLGRLTLVPTSRKAQYDLIWNFCEFENQTDPSLMISKMIRLSNKYLILITQNKRNPGVIGHFFFHLLIGRKWDHGDLNKMSYKSVLKILKKFENLRIIQISAFDVPWFILDVYECGKIFRNLPFLKNKLKGLQESRFEKWPLFVKMWLAHHHFLLIEKES